MASQAHGFEVRLQYRSAEAIASAHARRFAGVALFVLAAEFMTAIMLAASIAPNYDFGGGAISDLGVISETAMLFNASLVLIGVLNLIGGYFLYRSHASTWILATFGLAGLGAIGAGVIPLHTSDLHSIFALLAFVFFNVEALAGAALVRGPMRIVSLVAGIVGLAFVVLMVVGDSGNAALFGPIGHGGAERMIVYPVMLWMLAFGGYLLGETAEHSGEDVRRGA